jgi:hypothetical protein
MASTNKQSPLPLSERLTTDAVMIALATAGAYLIAFAFEAGYFRQFSLPLDLIRVELSSMLVALGSLCGGVFAIYHVANLVILIQPNNKRRVIANYYKLASLLIIVFIPLLYLSYGEGLFAEMAIVAGFFLIFETFATFVLPLLTQRSISGYLNKLDAQDQFEAGTEGAWAIVRNRFGRKALMLFGAIFYVILFAYFGGAASASTKKNHFVFDNDGTKFVVVRFQTNLCIAAELDREAGRFGPDYLLVPYPLEGPTVLTREELGVLQAGGPDHP